MTRTFKTAESPYKADNTASGKAGVTLMNNQVGAVVAQVMAKLPNVKVTYLPSMIRVDAVGRMDFDYDEISEALGEEPGYYDAAQFEENMSTHYGRMIHEDDRTIMFANPEDAAELIGFDATEVGNRARPLRTELTAAERETARITALRPELLETLGDAGFRRRLLPLFRLLLPLRERLPVRGVEGLPHRLRRVAHRLDELDRYVKQLKAQESKR